MDSLDVAAFSAWLRLAAARLRDRQAELSDLDAAIGDGDHGANMARGFTAVETRLAVPPIDLTALFKVVAMTLIGTVGGAAGPLYGSFFLGLSKEAGEAAALDAAGWRRVFAAGLAAVVSRGHAAPGEKTMVDALGPAAAAMERAGDGALPAALEAAALAAEQGAAGTVPLVARKGRASYLGERAIGHADPGATSSALLLAALADVAAGG